MIPLDTIQIMDIRNVHMYILVRVILPVFDARCFVRGSYHPSHRAFACGVS